MPNRSGQIYVRSHRNLRESIRRASAMELRSLHLLHLCFCLTGFMVGCSQSTSTSTGLIGPDYGISSLNRTTFPGGFIFGTASSAYQYEGATNEEYGRGPSIWDTYTHKYTGKIKDHSSGDMAVDSYHRYEEDVRMMKGMGLDAYRFSISWSRLLPYGKVSKGENRKGIMYYNSLINDLLANGIQPFVTLFHWDLPQSLEDAYGGFLDPQIVDDFRDYGDLCFREFGDRVKYWTTLNEPWSYSALGYGNGMLAPGRCSAWQGLNCTGGDSSTEPYLVAHHLLLAHATVVDLYRQKYQGSQKGTIGISLSSNWVKPYSKEKHDKNAALRALDFTFGWFMDPLTYGDYPHTLRSLVGRRLPRFTEEESMMLHGSYDFIGLNYYTSIYAAVRAPSFRNERPSYGTDAMVNLTAERNGSLIGPKAASDWLFVYPKGIHRLLRYTKRRYKNPIIFITENGVDEPNDGTLSLERALNDTRRIDYYHKHLLYVRHAIGRGINVKGYFAWSFLDNFEWNVGYTVRFGLNYVDYDNGLRRYPKLSSEWFKNFLKK